MLVAIVCSYTQAFTTSTSSVQRDVCRALEAGRDSGWLYDGFGFDNHERIKLIFTELGTTEVCTASLQPPHTRQVDMW